MTPDLKRLCEAATAAYEADADPSVVLYSVQAEAIVRAVLLALREPSDHMLDSVSMDDFPTVSSVLTPWETMIDHILADPVKA